jgi:hypothetical protein
MEELVSQSLIQKLRGLYTFPNDFSAVPEGALVVADNIIIDRDSVAEPRRGFTYLSHATARAGFPTSSDRARKIFFYDDTIICHLKDGSGNYKLAYFDPTTGWIYNKDSGGTTAYVAGPPSSTVKCRAISAKQNLYVTGAKGVLRIDDRDSVPIRAGLLAPLSVNKIQLLTGTGAWLAKGYAVAYRAVVGYRDENNNLYLSPPSGRVIVFNPAAVGSNPLVNPQINVTLPTGLRLGSFVQIYRSDAVQYQTESGGTVTPTGTIPNDELKLVYQETLTAGQIAVNLSSSITDIVPDETNFGAYLYTNSSQQGIELSNYRPPKCEDIANFKTCSFYAAITDEHYFELQLKTVDNFVVEDLSPLVWPNYIEIDGDKYYATHEFPDISAPWYSETLFGIETSDELTVSQQIEKTCMNLILIFNLANDDYYMQYVSGENDAPGKIIIKAYDVSASAFTIKSDAVNTWTPNLPTTGTIQTSVQEINPNRIRGSKPLEPEHCPLPYYWDAGSKNYKILRIIELSDSLFILKGDGVYRLYGSDPSNFQIALLDSTANIIAPDSAVVLNNQIFALTTQGVVAITETGVTIMSRPIESDLLDLLQINPAVLATESFAVAYESQRAYYLFIPELSVDTGPTQYYRYNTITNNWTRGTLAMAAGGVNPVDDKLYLGLPDKDYLYVENKSANSLDYSDYVSTNVIAAVSGKTVTIADAGLLSVGQVIYQLPSLATKTGATGTAGAFDHTQELITITAHGFSTGLIVTLSISGGDLPVGLVAGDYWVIKVAANTFKLAASYILAMAGTAVAFTDNGSEGRTASFVPKEKEVWGEIETLVDATHVTTKYPCQFVADAANIVNPIAAKMQWAPATFGNPGINKQVREISILFSSDFYGEANVGFSTDLSPTRLYETAQGSIAAPWGSFPWGSAPWGGTLRRRPLRVMVPRIHQRASFMSVSFEHEVCFSPWAIQGISFIGNNISEKVWHEGGGV